VEGMSLSDSGRHGGPSLLVTTANNQNSSAESVNVRYMSPCVTFQSDTRFLPHTNWSGFHNESVGNDIPDQVNALSSPNSWPPKPNGGKVVFCMIRQNRSMDVQCLARLGDL
jgi:hypothetical protein